MISASIFGSVAAVLCVGAHPDDIEIGAGGTLHRLLEVNPGVDLRFVVMTAIEQRAAEAHDSASQFLRDEGHLTVHDFGDGFLPYRDPTAVKEALADHRRGFVPEMVISPWSGDAHQDHRFLGELVWQLYRHQVILQFEIVKYEGDLGRPNLYVPLSETQVSKKIDGLFDSFPSQADKPWFDRELFRGHLRLRGIEAGSRYAEAFHAAKLTLG